MNQISDIRDHIFFFNNLPEFYKEVSSDYSNDFFIENTNTDFKELKNEFIVVKDIPRYFNVKRKKLSKKIKFLTVEQYTGFLIDFKGIDNLDSYLKTQFGNSSRYKLRRSIKKLETCFDISYKMYFGDITKQEYDFVFEEFFRLLKLRSLEKGILENRNIARKSYYYKLVYPLILDKKASLFVIYNGNNPIDICLNFHKCNMVYQLIRTYDINYSKFNTGYIDLIKQLEWCIDNEIRFITFSYGDYYWKRRWCNSTYKYDYDIFYNSRSIKSASKSLIYLTIIKVKHILRENGFIDKYHEIKNRLQSILSPKKNIEFEVRSTDFNTEFKIDQKIDFKDGEFDFLRRTIYELLFNFNENEKNIEVFKINNSSKEYLVVGKENKALILIK